MKFIYADSVDQVDPGYDFVRDRFSAGRKAYWTDQYAHEYYPQPPYAGILVSRGIVGDHIRKGKYTDAQAIRFRREGARVFLRLDSERFQHMPIYGDCGAFTYVKEKVPPYTSEDMAKFYADGRFTHGCSVDHVIFGFRTDVSGLEGAVEDEQARFDITLDNADSFLKATRFMKGFTPMGAVQGWSPDSMAIAAKRLEKMGYKYLAIGGMVPLSVKEIQAALQAIRAQIKSSTQLHILGFAKADSIRSFTKFNISSFDSTSPLYQAFMDAKNNYYVRAPGSELNYYTAVRIPLATEDKALKAASQEGLLRQEVVTKLESSALDALRRFDRGAAPLEEAVTRVMDYQTVYQKVKCKTEKAFAKALKDTEASVRRTLGDRPWKNCGCQACRQAGIDVVIFRSSNRNKRRGFHNLHIYSEHLQQVLYEEENIALRRAVGAARS